MQVANSGKTSLVNHANHEQRFLTIIVCVNFYSNVETYSCAISCHLYLLIYDNSTSAMKFVKEYLLHV